MIPIIAAIFVHTLALQAIANNLMLHDTSDEVVDKMLNKLVDKLFTPPVKSISTPYSRPLFKSERSQFLARSMSASDLPGSGPWKKLAISAIDVNTRRNQMRDVSMKAKVLAAEVSKLDATSKGEAQKLETAVALKAKDMAGVTAPMGFFDP